MIGTLVNHNGAARVTRAELRTIQPPPGTRTWKPIRHSELIDVLEKEITRRSLKIREEAYAVQRGGALLFGVIDLAWRQTEECAAAIGLRTANDKTLSIQLAVGFRVFVCDNLAFAGDLIALQRKHTARLDLEREVEKAMDRYQEGVLSLEQDIVRLKETSVSDQEAKVLIFDTFRQAILPVRFFRPVSESYFNPSVNGSDHPSRTSWALHNAFTRHVQQLPPSVAFSASARLGRSFGLGKSSIRP